MNKRGYIIAAVIAIIVAICIGIYYYQTSTTPTQTPTQTPITAASGIATLPVAKKVPVVKSTGTNYNGTIQMGSSFKPGDTLTSANGAYIMRYSSKYGLEIVHISPNGAILSRKIAFPGQFDTFDMQTDGNAVIYVKNVAAAASNTENDGGKYLLLQGDGNLCVNNGQRNLWCLTQGWGRENLQYAVLNNLF